MKTLFDFFREDSLDGTFFSPILFCSRMMITTELYELGVPVSRQSQVLQKMFVVQKHIDKTYCVLSTGRILEHG
jgi:hypothetical protein